MKEIITEWRQFLTEKVFGAQAFVYHGSKLPPEKFAEILIKDEFIPGKGSGAMYGRGLYTVYDYQNSATETGEYGEYIYKLKVNLYGFISFDSDVTRLIYKKDMTPSEQAEMLGKPKLAKKLSALPEPESSEFTSDIADPASKFLSGEVKGIIFTGRGDGKVAVVYDASIVVPVAWKHHTEKEWNAFDKSMLANAISRSATDKWEELRYSSEIVELKKIRKLPPEKRVFEGDLLLNKLRVDLDLPPDLKVTGKLDISNSFMKHLPPNLSVGGEMWLSYSQVEELPANLKVGSNLIMFNTKIKTLPNDLEVGGNIVGFKGDMYDVPRHLKWKMKAFY